MREFHCPKCESTNIRIEYRDGAWTRLTVVPRLMCFCLRCDYRWDEKTSDDKSGIVKDA